MTCFHSKYCKICFALFVCLEFNLGNLRYEIFNLIFLGENPLDVSSNKKPKQNINHAMDPPTEITEDRKDAKQANNDVEKDAKPVPKDSQKLADHEPQNGENVLSKGSKQFNRPNQPLTPATDPKQDTSDAKNRSKQTSKTESQAVMIDVTNDVLANGKDKANNVAAQSNKSVEEKQTAEEFSKDTKQRKGTPVLENAANIVKSVSQDLRDVNDDNIKDYNTMEANKDAKQTAKDAKKLKLLEAMRAKNAERLGNNNSFF